VTLKLHRNTVALLGTAPRAEIRPTTVLGGTYYVSLIPGGRPGSPADARIPLARTSSPVELEQLLAAIPPHAQRSMQRTIGLLDQTLAAGAVTPLQQLLHTAPDTLGPAADVLDAARGTHPDTDLAALVSNLDQAARVLSRHDGQLGAVVDSLARTSAVLATEARPVAASVGTLPDTLAAVRQGADDLSASLDRVPPTAEAITPAVEDLQPLLRRLDPALADAHDLLHQARPLLGDARPLVHRLVPTSRVVDDVLGDVNGPVLDRVNGPILGTVVSDFRGRAPKYPGGTSEGHPLYAELGYMLSNLDGAMKAYDGNGSMISFQPGIGTSSLLGLPDPLGPLADLRPPPSRSLGPLTGLLGGTR
jgi:phospholipid/cholesterol/gamma-HCH transport system substrate-binding protein